MHGGFCSFELEGFMREQCYMRVRGTESAFTLELLTFAITLILYIGIEVESFWGCRKHSFGGRLGGRWAGQNEQENPC